MHTSRLTKGGGPENLKVRGDHTSGGRHGDDQSVSTQHTSLGRRRPHIRPATRQFPTQLRSQPSGRAAATAEHLHLVVPIHGSRPSCQSPAPSPAPAAVLPFSARRRPRCVADSMGRSCTPATVSTKRRPCKREVNRTRVLQRGGVPVTKGLDIDKDYP